MNFKSRRVARVFVISGIVFCVAIVIQAQSRKGRRDAFGSERASYAEKLLEHVYSGAKVEWDPVLAIRQHSGELVPVDLGDFSTTRRSDGTTDGIALLEIGTDKSEYIKKLKKFQRNDTQTYTSQMVVFHMDPTGRISDLKKVRIDPNDPLTKIDWFEVQNWPANGWPIVRLRYTSYVPSSESLVEVEWGGLLDMATGSFLTRIPSGVFVTEKGGREGGDILSVHRTGPDRITIVGYATKRSVEYSCSDPCVIDGPTFLAKWSK
jgi:hypothetical protein